VNKVRVGIRVTVITTISLVSVIGWGVELCLNLKVDSHNRAVTCGVSL